MRIEGSEDNEVSTSPDQQPRQVSPAQPEQGAGAPANGSAPQPGGGNGVAGNGSAANAWPGRRPVKRHAPQWVELPEVEPWPEAVNGAELLDALVKELQRFVLFPKWAVETIALWIVHTFAFRLRDLTTYLGIESPERECGKSTLVTVLSELADRAAVSSNISSSAFFHVIEDLQPTLLIDEADTNLRGRDDLAGILNSGYTKRTAFVWRVCYEAAPGPGPEGLEDEEQQQPGGAGVGSTAARAARYSSWCPKAIAMIGRLEPTLASRCIVLQMHRKTEEEACERMKHLDGTELKRKCARFVADHAAAIASAEPAIPRGLTNRAADIWEPLLALADLAGGRWPAVAREAAQGLTARAKAYSPIGSLLLDLFLIFAEAEGERMFSRDLVSGLLACGERPWAELRKGKPVTETWLAQQLRPYNVQPKTIRIGDRVSKGYVKEEFRETFRRYIPKSEVARFQAELMERVMPEEKAPGEAGKKEGGSDVEKPGQAQREADGPAPGEG